MVIKALSYNIKWYGLRIIYPELYLIKMAINIYIQEI